MTDSRPSDLGSMLGQESVVLFFLEFIFAKSVLLDEDYEKTRMTILAKGRVCVMLHSCVPNYTSERLTMRLQQKWRDFSQDSFRNEINK